MPSMKIGDCETPSGAGALEMTALEKRQILYPESRAMLRTKITQVQGKVEQRWGEHIPGDTKRKNLTLAERVYVLGAKDYDAELGGFDHKVDSANPLAMFTECGAFYYARIVGQDLGWGEVVAGNGREEKLAAFFAAQLAVFGSRVHDFYFNGKDRITESADILKQQNTAEIRESFYPPVGTGQQYQIPITSGYQSLGCSLTQLGIIILRYSSDLESFASIERLEEWRNLFGRNEQKMRRVVAGTILDCTLAHEIVHLYGPQI